LDLLNILGLEDIVLVPKQTTCRNITLGEDGHEGVRRCGHMDGNFLGYICVCARTRVGVFAWMLMCVYYLDKK